MIKMILTHLYEKAGDVFSHVWGWLLSLLLLVADVFAGQGVLVSTIVLLTFVDAVWGTAVAIKRRRFALSELLRQTAGKFAVYGCALFGFLAIDYYLKLETGLEISITSGLVGIVISMTELWSCSANMLILFPDFPVLKLLQKQLTGEIASKLGCEPSEVKEVLAGGRIPPKRGSNGRFVSRKKK